MSPVPGPSWTVARWVPAIGLAVVLAFAALAWANFQRLVELERTLRPDADNVVWTYTQVEVEHERLAAALNEAILSPDGVDAAALRLRYELFASRVALLDPLQSKTALEPVAEDLEALQQLRALLSRSDPWLAEGSTASLDADSLAPLLADTLLVRPAARGLVLRAHARNIELAHQRRELAREDFRIGTLLTGLMALLTWVMALLSARQFRLARSRTQQLEAAGRELLQAREHADAANVAKSVFLANMSHELRTPLHGLLGMLTLMEASPLSQRQAGQLNTARDSANHLLHLLNEVLDLSKLESGKLDIVTGPMSLAHTLADVRALMRVSAVSKGLELRCDFADDLPDWITADSQRLKQILYNLLSNAIKFTDRGTVTLTARRHTLAGQPGLEFEVTDTGIGIPETLQAQLFERFGRIDQDGLSRFSGTGLGLQISRELARLMGGDVHCSSSPGHGSTFSATVRFEPCAEPPAAPATLAATSKQPQTPPARDLDLLIVDDQPVNRQFLEELFELWGHRPRSAVDGQAAVAAVRERVPDAIFMDLHMPGLDGFEATAQIRSLGGAAADVPIIAVTADVFADTQRRVLASRMDGFLAKPMATSKLQGWLDRVARHPARQALSAAPAAASEATPAAPRPPTDPMPPVRVDAGERASWSRLAGELAAWLDMQMIGEACIRFSPDRYRLFLAKFLRDRQNSLAALADGLQPLSAQEVRSHAHAAKGTAGTLGLRALQDASRALEALALDATTPATEIDRARADLAHRVEQTQRLLERLGLLEHAASVLAE